MILQNICYPDPEICDVREMYFHRKNRKMIFDGYFNIFSAAKWMEYTVIRDFHLFLQLEGKAIIRIFDQDGLLQEGECEESADIALSLKKTSRCIWFETEMSADGNPAVSGYFYTDQSPVQNVHLAGDICTFRREKYLIHNLHLLQKSLIDNPDCSLYHNFDLFVVDNGQTLKKKEIENDHVFLFPNENSGGSGGFTRGLIEINNAKDRLGLTHMIFMDDDAVLCPESFIRTHALLSYVNEKYAKAAVSGAMLRLNQPYIQHEYGVKWDGTTPYTRYPALDLRVRNNVIRNEALDEADYAAWWYACYPLTETGMDNLPLPLFLHNDDIEYGLRHKNNRFILLNGICVWSPGFENKRSSSLNYYDVRNTMITAALTSEDGLEKRMQKYCWKRILAALLRYRYHDASLVYKGAADFCKGPEYLGTLDPVKLNQEISSMSYKLQPVEDLTDDPAVLKEIDEYQQPENAEEMFAKRNKDHKWFYALTLNGWIFPAHKDRIYPFPMGEWPYALYRKGKVLLFDPDTKKGILGEKSYKGLFQSVGVYIRIARLMHDQYETAVKEYQNKAHWLEDYACWKEYLKLNDK